MVQFRLPPESRVGPGKVHRVKDSKVSKRIYIYRYDPDHTDKPRLDSYELTELPLMVLDILIENRWFEQPPQAIEHRELVKV